jgi:Histone H1-like protein Hc1
MSALNEFETLKKMVADAEDDVRKADGGNKAAGTRVRKKMQEIKQAAQAVRVKILESRGSEEEGGGQPSAEGAE